MQPAIPFLGLFLPTLALAQFTNQSAPFWLVVESHDKYAGTALGSCHEGAAIEGLCPGNTVNTSASYEFYHFNTSSFAQQPLNATSGEQGLITYELMGSNFNLSEPMSLSFNPTSNVAMALFLPSSDTDATAVAFDVNELLNIQDQTGVAYYRWYICSTNYGGYQYDTLNWVIGSGQPENDSCCPANIVRRWIQ